MKRQIRIGINEKRVKQRHVQSQYSSEQPGHLATPALLLLCAIFIILNIDHLEWFRHVYSRKARSQSQKYEEQGDRQDGVEYER
jgi:hypothetical protein